MRDCKCQRSFDLLILSVWVISDEAHSRFSALSYSYIMLITVSIVPFLAFSYLRVGAMRYTDLVLEPYHAFE